MNKLCKLSLLAVSLFLGACTSENEQIGPNGPNEGSGDDTSRREVLLNLKNKLNLTAGKTKADDPIATAEENYIRSLDIYVFGSLDEFTGYTFQELYYYRDDAATIPGDGDWAHSFNLTASDKENITTALLKLQKGMFVKLYCVVNRTTLYQTDGGGTVSAFTGFQPLAQSAPGQAGNVVTPGVPTEDDFLKLHSAAIDPAAATPTENDVITTPLPMTGSYTTPLDLTDFSLAARTQISFKLTRMVARFDIVNKSADSKFTIESISMGNGQKGASFFPIKTQGNAPADLITYPVRTADAATQAAGGELKGAFYTWPSPKDDHGYLILKGKYAVNQTQTLDVSYQVPFQQIKDNIGTYIEVDYNHRYTIGITKADTYHLDFTLSVADWTDEADIDEYDPNSGNNFDKAPVTLITDAGASVGAYVMDDGRISVLPQAASKFAFEMQSNTPLEEKLIYKEGSAEWLVIDAGGRTKAASLKAKYAYKIDDTTLDGAILPVTIRLSNPASGKRKDIIVTPTVGPKISLKEGLGSFKDGVLTMHNSANQTAKLHVVAETREAQTGSTLTIDGTPDWLTVDVDNLSTAEGDYTLTLTKEAPLNAEANITITSTASTAVTKMTLKLIELINPGITKKVFDNGGNEKNTFLHINETGDGFHKIILGEATASSSCSLKVDSRDGVTIENKIDWLNVNAQDQVNDNGSHTTKLTFTIVDGTDLSKALHSDNSVKIIRHTKGGGNTDDFVKVETTVAPVVPPAP